MCPAKGRPAGWAHVRRGMYELRQGWHAGGQLLHLIQRLHRVDIETQLADPTESALLAARQHRSTPLVDEIFAVAQCELALLSPASGQGKALQYMLNREAELRRFLSDARIPIDNNISERALRTVALGRNGSLFVGPGDNGQDLAIILTVLRTCELVGASPQHYLEDVLVKLRRLSARKDLPDDAGPELDTLTPARWKAERDRQPG
jgi:transposase